MVVRGGEGDGCWGEVGEMVDVEVGEMVVRRVDVEMVVGGKVCQLQSQKGDVNILVKEGV